MKGITTTFIENYRGFDICHIKDKGIDWYLVDEADFGQHSHASFDFRGPAFYNPTVEHVKKDIDLYLAFVEEGEKFRDYNIRIERLKDIIRDYGWDIKRYQNIVKEYEDVL